MAVNAVTRNTKRILILNEELNEQREGDLGMSAVERAA